LQNLLSHRLTSCHIALFSHSVPLLPLLGVWYHLSASLPWLRAYTCAALLSKAFLTPVCKQPAAMLALAYCRCGSWSRLQQLTCRKRKDYANKVTLSARN